MKHMFSLEHLSKGECYEKHAHVDVQLSSYYFSSIYKFLLMIVTINPPL